MRGGLACSVAGPAVSSRTEQQSRGVDSTAGADDDVRGKDLHGAIDFGHNASYLSAGCTHRQRLHERIAEQRDIRVSERRVHTQQVCV